MGQSAGARARSLSFAVAVVTGSQYLTFCDDDHMATTEFLLQLANKADLDFVVLLQLLERNLNDDSLLICACWTYRYFASTSDVPIYLMFWF
jgi:hypothetical protein